MKIEEIADRSNRDKSVLRKVWFVFLYEFVL